jgi:senataxin
VDSEQTPLVSLANPSVLIDRLSTAIREFGALKGLPYYEPSLLRDILAGKGAEMPRLRPDAVVDAKKAYDVNEPQAKAILGAMDSLGFALIQGYVAIRRT